MRPAFGLLLASLLGACANIPSNQPLVEKYDQTYQFEDWIKARGNLDPELIVMSFSGGGVRAAALADSVLEQLRKEGLADKIAIISSTSGGSVTAGFVAAKGVGALPELRSQFLYHDNTADLTPRLLPSFLFGGNRSQKFAAYLDERLFQGKPPTYGELKGRWGGAPFVILNASDTSTGRTFEFTQQTFNSLCSDILKYPLSEGIAASSSFPFLLNAIPLKNHWDSKDCRERVNPFPPEGFEKEFSAKDHGGRYVNLDAYVKARYVHSLRYTYDNDPQNVPYRRIEYVHLLDGGLSDNLAARALLRAFAPDAVLKSLIEKNVRKILLVQVNAKSDDVRESVDRSGDVPSWLEVFKTVAFNPIDVATALSSYISKAYWVSLIDYRNAAQDSGKKLTFYPVQVDFDQMTPNSKDQESVKKIGTWWSLSEIEVKLVDKTGRDLLIAHPCFQAFMRSSNAEWNPAATSLVACSDTFQLAEGPVPPAAAPTAAPPRPPAAAPPAPVAAKITMAADVLFDFGKASLRPEAHAKLDGVVAKLKSVNLEVVITVGHADRIGDERYNIVLSTRRAEAVKAYLVTMGVPAGRIYTEGKGSSQPVAKCDAKEREKLIECLAPNRRVEIEFVGTRVR